MRSITLVSRFADRSILAHALREDPVGALLVHRNGVEPVFQLAVNMSISAMTSLTEPMLPWRIAGPVRTLNDVSTWLSHDVEGSVKRRVIRG